MRERIKDCDKRYCADCCTMWSKAKGDCRVRSDLCALSVGHKLSFMGRERHRPKAWTEEYGAHLQRMVKEYCGE